MQQCSNATGLMGDTDDGSYTARDSSSSDDSDDLDFTAVQRRPSAPLSSFNWASVDASLERRRSSVSLAGSGDIGSVLARSPTEVLSTPAVDRAGSDSLASTAVIVDCSDSKQDRIRSSLDAADTNASARLRSDVGRPVVSGTATARDGGTTVLRHSYDDDEGHEDDVVEDTVWLLPANMSLLHPAETNHDVRSTELSKDVSVDDVGQKFAEVHPREATSSGASMPDAVHPRLSRSVVAESAVRRARSFIRQVSAEDDDQEVRPSQHVDTPGRTAAVDLHGPRANYGEVCSGDETSSDTSGSIPFQRSSATPLLSTAHSPLAHTSLPHVSPTDASLVHPVSMHVSPAHPPTSHSSPKLPSPEHSSPVNSSPASPGRSHGSLTHSPPNEPSPALSPSSPDKPSSTFCPLNKPLPRPSLPNEPSSRHSRDEPSPRHSSPDEPPSRHPSADKLSPAYSSPNKSSSTHSLSTVPSPINFPLGEPSQTHPEIPSSTSVPSKRGLYIHSSPEQHPKSEEFSPQLSLALLPSTHSPPNPASPPPLSAKQPSIAGQSKSTFSALSGTDIATQMSEQTMEGEEYAGSPTSVCKSQLSTGENSPGDVRQDLSDSLAGNKEEGEKSQTSLVKQIVQPSETFRSSSDLSSVCQPAKAGDTESQHPMFSRTSGMSCSDDEAVQRHNEQLSCDGTKQDTNKSNPPDDAVVSEANVADNTTTNLNFQGFNDEQTCLDEAQSVLGRSKLNSSCSQTVSTELHVCGSVADATSPAKHVQNDKQSFAASVRSDAVLSREESRNIGHACRQDRMPAEPSNQCETTAPVLTSERVLNAPAARAVCSTQERLLSNAAATDRRQDTCRSTSTGCLTDCDIDRMMSHQRVSRCGRMTDGGRMTRLQRLVSGPLRRVRQRWRSVDNLGLPDARRTCVSVDSFITASASEAGADGDVMPSALVDNGDVAAVGNDYWRRSSHSVAADSGQESKDERMWRQRLRRRWWRLWSRVGRRSPYVKSTHTYSSRPRLGVGDHSRSTEAQTADGAMQQLRRERQSCMMESGDAAVQFLPNHLNSRASSGSDSPIGRLSSTAGRAVALRKSDAGVFCDKSDADKYAAQDGDDILVVSGGSDDEHDGDDDDMMMGQMIGQWASTSLPDNSDESVYRRQNRQLRFLLQQQQCRCSSLQWRLSAAQSEVIEQRGISEAHRRRYEDLAGQLATILLWPRARCAHEGPGSTRTTVDPHKTASRLMRANLRTFHLWRRLHLALSSSRKHQQHYVCRPRSGRGREQLLDRQVSRAAVAGRVPASSIVPPPAQHGHARQVAYINSPQCRSDPSIKLHVPNSVGRTSLDEAITRIEETSSGRLPRSSVSSTSPPARRTSMTSFHPATFGPLSQASCIGDHHETPPCSSASFHGESPGVPVVDVPNGQESATLSECVTQLAEIRRELKRVQFLLTSASDRDTGQCNNAVVSVQQQQQYGGTVSQLPYSSRLGGATSWSKGLSSGGSWAASTASHDSCSGDSGGPSSCDNSCRLSRGNSARNLAPVANKTSANVVEAAGIGGVSGGVRGGEDEGVVAGRSAGDYLRLCRQYSGRVRSCEARKQVDVKQDYVRHCIGPMLERYNKGIVRTTSINSGNSQDAYYRRFSLPTNRLGSTLEYVSPECLMGVRRGAGVFQLVDELQQRVADHLNMLHTADVRAVCDFDDSYDSGASHDSFDLCDLSNSHDSNDMKPHTHINYSPCTNDRI